MRRILLAVVAVVLTFGAFGTAVQARPEIDPHYTQGRDPGCGLLPDYYDSINTVFEDHPDFTSYFVDRVNLTQQLSDDEVEEIFANGEAFLEDFDTISPPAAYEQAHIGIRLLYDLQLQYLYFLTIDASSGVDVYQQDKAINLIVSGERGAAAQCPDEIDEFGGFIFIDPATFE